MRYNLRVLQFLRLFFLAPLLRLVWRKRVLFERKNQLHPFKSESAQALFEISSQGEWEQVRPLVLALLEQGAGVDILYASASVEKEMLAFEELHPSVRTKRLELLTNGRTSALKAWSQAKWVFFCRYDFYPELLLLKGESQLVLLNGTLKNKQGVIKRWFMRSILKDFHTIVWSSDFDLKRGQELRLPVGIDQRVGDLRPLAILARLKKAPQHFKNLGLERLATHLKAQNQSASFLVGSAWPSDVDFLADSKVLLAELKSKKRQLWLAPHQLGRESREQFERILKEHPWSQFESYFLLDDQFDEAQLAGASIVVNFIGRILCESYPHFAKVMVGGGFERSVHSISEPFYAGCTIAVGPKVHRSTEYEEALSLDSARLKVLETPVDLDHFLGLNLPNASLQVHDRETQLIELRNHLCSLAMSTPPL